MNNPLVTVIIPAYNHEAYVADCIESVCNQTYKNIQLIIIDDGSTDNTKQEIEKTLARKKKDALFISKKNEGLIKTLNFGITLARGKYFSSLASDDLWLPNKIEKQVELMENNPTTGFIFSDAYFCYDMQKTDVKYSRYKPGILKFKSGIPISLYNKLLVENLIISTTVLIKMEALQAIGCFDSTLTYEDYDMWLRLSREFKIIYLNEPLAYYRIHGSNFSKQNLKMLKGATHTLSKQYELLKKEHSLLYIVALQVMFYFKLIKTKLRKRKIIRLIKNGE